MNVSISLQRRCFRMIMRGGVLALFLLSASYAGAQPFSPQDPFYKIPPAMAGHGNDFVVVQNRTALHHVLVAESGATSLGDAIALPADVHGVWHLSMPDPSASVMVGLASYREGEAIYYGILRSADMGNNWELIRPAALREKLSSVSDDYWRAPIRTICWLPDGQHGWLWGHRAIFRTADAGLSWELAYMLPGDDDDNLQNDDRVNALVFRDANNGVAVMGTYYTQRMYSTSDGGKTWAYAGLQLGQNHAVRVDWVGGEYRLLSADPFKPLDKASNTAMHFSSNAQDWSFRAPTIPTHQTEMTSVFWEGDSAGTMILRSGEMWRTYNGGRRWTKIHERDPNYPVEFAYYPGTQGFGGSILLGRGASGNFVLEAITEEQSGEILRLKSWPVALVASVPSGSSSAGDAARLQLGSYPNPASYTTDIVFTLPYPSRVRVSLIDRRGEEIHRVEHLLLGAGDQRIAINLADIPAGSYQYILEAEGVRGSGSLVVTR